MAGPDITVHHRRALDATRAIVAGIGDDQWGAPTPCDDWDVRTLLGHVVAGNWWASRLAAGATIEEVGDEYDGDVLGPDPIRAYDDSAQAAARVFEAPGALEAPCAVSYGPVPGEVYAGHRLIDVVVHGWDLAVATGQETTLDPALVDATLRVIEPQLDALRASGAFGAEQVVPDDAAPQDRLLLLVGRTPV